MKRLLDLNERDCRWPLSMATDEKPEDIRFCGCDRVFNSPYCAEHRDRAWATPRPPKHFRLSDKQARVAA